MPLPDAFAVAYLESGNDRQQALFAALSASGVLVKLVDYQPALVSTIGLGIDLPNSDVDIVCSAASPREFQLFAHREWYGAHDYRSLLLSSGEVVVQFSVAGFLFELYCSSLPTAEQAGVRHFQQVARVLAMGGDLVRELVMKHRWQGAKTEVAVASALGLEGDPYEAVLALETLTDAAVQARLDQISAGLHQ